jgi:opacity protein-like surface antigen
MVKYFSIALLVIAFLAVPARAQDIAPQVEIMLGYGNLSLPDTFEANDLTIGTGGHSGFASSQTFNMNDWFGIDNYLGYYGLGETQLGIGKAELITTMFGGKFAYRRFEKVVPYATAGLGGAWLRFPQFGAGSDTAFSTRVGAGVDYSIHDSVAIRFDVSRMSFNFEGWRSGLNYSTGIVLKMAF